MSVFYEQINDDDDDDERSIRSPRRVGIRQELWCEGFMALYA